MVDKGTSLQDIFEGVGGAFLILSALLTPFLRHWRCRWGATDEEVQRTLPGDDLVPNPKWRWTHAITIGAPPERVWPWIVQMGQGRGGFYSYEALEDLVGCRIHNADRIVPEWQDLKVGDAVKLHPRVPGLPVAILDPDRSLVLNGRMDMRTGKGFDLSAAYPERYMNMVWMWYLEPSGPEATRLLSRFGTDYNPIFANRLFYGMLFVEPIGFTMSRKMLLGIKRRAEAVAG